MKNHLFPIFSILFVSVLFSSCDYEKITSLDAKVQVERQKIELTYKKKNKIAQKLINSVRKRAPDEKQKLKAVTKARSNAFNAVLNPKDLSQEKIRKYETTQNKLSSTLSDLLMLVEDYPELKTSSDIKSLKAELELVDKDLSEKCKAYNESLVDYNALVTSSPTLIYAGIIGYKKRGEFKAGLISEN